MRENRKNGISWRILGRRLGVNHATICRFAKSKGKWKPKDLGIQKKLGILKVKKKAPKPITRMLSQRMENDLINALQNKTPLPNISTRITLSYRESEWWISTKPIKAGAQ